MVVFLLIIIFEYLKMKKINKYVKIVLLIIVLMMVSFHIYMVYFYEDTRWNVATPPTPKQVEEYENKFRNK